MRPAWGCASFVALACGTTSGADGTTADAGATHRAAIGAPCVPAAETRPAFGGASAKELDFTVSSADAGLEQPLCLAYHFQGRVTCPYGQDAAGSAPTGASPCTTPSGQPVTVAVRPQCVDRRAADTVFTSCRCASVDGGADPGVAYCTCPASMTCTPLVTFGDNAGSYCVGPRAAYDASTACTASCTPATCPP